MEAGSPIKTFIEQVKNQAGEGLGDWEFKEPIRFEMSTVVGSEGGAGLNISVISLGTKVKAEEVQKIKMSIGPKDEVSEAQKKAEIAKAEAEARYARQIALAKA